EFARLECFDLVKYTVVDPMHNLLLGVSMLQWYTQWIKTGTLRAHSGKHSRELNVIHQFLETVLPHGAGRLPLRIEEPARVSLTAAEYKFAVTRQWSIIISVYNLLRRVSIEYDQIPVVWERFLEESKTEFDMATTRYKAVPSACHRYSDYFDGRAKGEPIPSCRLAKDGTGDRTPSTENEMGPHFHKKIFKTHEFYAPTAVKPSLRRRPLFRPPSSQRNRPVAVPLNIFSEPLDGTGRLPVRRYPSNRRDGHGEQPC
ncbi:hypothetical protein K438DRAFT_1646892, partial [Mycena galopus ATCC 62051]